MLNPFYQINKKNIFLQNTDKLRNVEGDWGIEKSFKFPQPI